MSPSLSFKHFLSCDYSHEIKRHLLLGRKTLTNLDSILKSRDIILQTKVGIVKAMVFFSSHVWMWELDHKEGWKSKNWCFWIVVLEKTLKNPLDNKEVKPVNPNIEVSPEYLLEELVLKLNTLATWWKTQITGKDPDAGKDWRQEEKWVAEMRWLDPWLSGHGFEQMSRDSEG